ncbi:MAG: hypothetical protein KJ583_00740 [Nanoarchaeota archaeon]|nr:hypothetical protein [Nanoarchaeota archaeon]MBU1269620.1 hypothetical protein [Nanoarchaeota archaeon]MBU1603816.1 hypothetical protein [Nanoarchaeota archaeon]MBU2443248.1 hypothetical protein [Nanoarchaeota archaeon]
MLTVSSPKTLGKRMMNYVGIGVATIIAYAGVEAITSSRVQSDYNDRIEVFRETMKKDVEMAQNMLSEFREKNILKEADKLEQNLRSYI